MIQFELTSLNVTSVTKIDKTDGMYQFSFICRGLRNLVLYQTQKDI